jgi:uncharacterized membrane protein
VKEDKAMWARLRQFMVRIRGQLWLVPALCGAVAAAAAVLTLTVSFKLDHPGQIWWAYGGDAESARGLLSSLLSGMMTITSLVVSMTFVALSLAANQLGPRLIPNFIEDRQIQLFVGLFIGTILYVLITLRSVDGMGGNDTVPQLAVTISGVLSVACLFALLFYMNKMAYALNADTVVRTVSARLQHEIKAISAADTACERPGEHWPKPDGWIGLPDSGYVLTVDHQAMARAAKEHACVLEVDVKPGRFVLAHGAHIGVLGGDPANEDLRTRVQDAVAVGPEPSPAQDVEFSIRQLVEIGLRALSPGINDPRTAITVIHHLSLALERIVADYPEGDAYCDDDGKVRVLAERTSLSGAFGASLDQIRQAGRAHPAILIEIADALGRIRPPDERARTIVAHHLRALRDELAAAGFTEMDEAAVRARIERAQAAAAHRHASETTHGA